MSIIMSLINFYFYFAAALSGRYPEISHEAIKKATQKWLNGAPDRKDPTTGYGGKTDRVKRTKARKEEELTREEGLTQ